MKINHFLPPNISSEQVVARIGLISDTHMPERCAAFPSSLFEVLRGVDLLLHVGDVGKLWVLDHLSTIAPVVAVHGNDETLEATQELPHQQLITVAGQRLLLWHSHYPDRDIEMASRCDDVWQLKLARCAEQGQRTGAKIVIFGHTHIPMTYQYEDVLLVNPGAMASDSVFTRQSPQTVAILFISRDGKPSVSHVDLAVSNQIYTPHIDWNTGFKDALAQFSAPIVALDLMAEVALLKEQTYSDVNSLREAVLRISHRCWSGQQQYITRVDLLNEVLTDPKIPSEDKTQVEKILISNSTLSKE